MGCSNFYRMPTREDFERIDIYDMAILVANSLEAQVVQFPGTVLGPEGAAKYPEDAVG
jgi:hypothetical protein